MLPLAFGGLNWVSPVSRECPRGKGLTATDHSCGACSSGGTARLQGQLSALPWEQAGPTGAGCLALPSVPVLHPSSQGPGPPYHLQLCQQHSLLPPHCVWVYILVTILSATPHRAGPCPLLPGPSLPWVTPAYIPGEQPNSLCSLMISSLSRCFVAFSLLHP